ncbi:MAG: hypothetical protein RSE96_11425, partial [Niameybacter sp.]
LWGANSSPSFDVAFEAQKNIITDKIGGIEALLNTDEIKDNVSPAIEKLAADEIFAVPVGTDPSSINWAEKFKAVDNLDGELDITKAVFNVEVTDFNTVGEYEKGLVVTIQDLSENTGKSNNNVIVYDANNKEVPTITLKEEYRALTLEEETAKINWNDFVETAVDKDGINIKSSLHADLSTLDTTTKGEYEIPLTVTDFAGNVAEVVLPVTVE